jgi:hypothetical protein
VDWDWEFFLNGLTRPGRIDLPGDFLPGCQPRRSSGPPRFWQAHQVQVGVTQSRAASLDHSPNRSAFGVGASTGIRGCSASGRRTVAPLMLQEAGRTLFFSARQVNNEFRLPCLPRASMGGTKGPRRPPSLRHHPRHQPLVPRHHRQGPRPTRGKSSTPPDRLTHLSLHRKRMRRKKTSHTEP